MQQNTVDSFVTEPFVEELAKGGFLPPIGHRSPYTTSRLAVLADGTTAPVLQILALRKYEKWPEDRFPFWIDGAYENETLANVALATRASRRGTPRLRRRSAFGAPAGSKEYMRAWRAENRERVRANSKRFAEKRNAILKQLAAVDETAPSTVEADRIEDDPIIEKLRRAVGEA
jgi:hypothetical protein